MQFVLREDFVSNFTLCFALRVTRSRSVIAFSRFDRQPRTLLEFHFQYVEAPIILQVLRSKPQQVRVFRNGRQLRDSAGEVVAVMKVTATGGVGHFEQRVSLRDQRRRIVALHVLRINGAAPGFLAYVHAVRRLSVQALYVERVDYDPSADRTIQIVSESSL